MARMIAAESLRYQNFNIPAQQVFTGIIKHFFRLRIHQNDFAFSVDNDDCIRRGFQQAFEFLLRLLAVSDVANGAHRHSAFFGRDGAQTNFDRKFLAVLAQSVEFEPGAHRAGAWLAKISRAMSDMTATKASRQQRFDEFTAQLPACITEKFVSLTIRELNAAGRIDHHDAVGHGFQKIAKFGFYEFRVTKSLKMCYVLFARKDKLGLPLRVGKGFAGNCDIY